jgi:hypothetical protein
MREAIDLPPYTHPRFSSAPPLTKPPERASEVHEDVLDYCNGESEQFAKDDCIDEARKLHASGKGWTEVLVDLHRSFG